MNSNLAAVKSNLAPTGVLRVAINYGNATLATRDAAGNLKGISVDIAAELGKRLDLPPLLLPFNGAGKVTEAAELDVWDVAFLAGEPERAHNITFTAPYIVIDGSYVVHSDSSLETVAQVDREGVRIAVIGHSASDLFLTRTLRHAKIKRDDKLIESVARFSAERLEVLAGVKHTLEEIVALDPSLRLIPQPFMTIHQAMGMPSGRPAGATYLAAFVEDIKASGFLAQILKQNNQVNANVAPPA